MQTTTDFETWNDRIQEAQQVVIIKRYDDNDGMYTCAFTQWPNIYRPMEDPNPYGETMRRGDFLRDVTAFCTDLIGAGFTPHPWTDFTGPEWAKHDDVLDEDQDFQSYVTFNILPIEWHRSMHLPGMAARVAVYTRAS